MEVVSRWPFLDEEYPRVHSWHEMWMYFRSPDLITDDHVQQLGLSIAQDPKARPVGELEASGDQSAGLRAIEHNPKYIGASSPINDAEATHTNPSSGSGNLGPTYL
jgi:hypothetical protein